MGNSQSVLLVQHRDVLKHSPPSSAKLRVQLAEGIDALSEQERARWDRMEVVEQVVKMLATASLAPSKKTIASGARLAIPASYKPGITLLWRQEQRRPSERLGKA